MNSSGPSRPDIARPCGRANLAPSVPATEPVRARVGAPAEMTIRRTEREEYAAAAFFLRARADDRVAVSDVRWTVGIRPKTGWYLACACHRLAAKHVDARGSGCGAGAGDNGDLQQPCHVKPARKTEQQY